MPVDTHDDIMPATGIDSPNVVETHEDIKPAMGMTAYHGTPHKFDEFDTSKIGTGEGAQAYGHGLYFAENEDVADQYRKNSEGKYAPNSIARRMLNGWKDRDLAIQKQAEYISKLEKSHNEDFIAPYRGALEILKSGKEPRVGHMYEVRLNVGPEHLLDWDKPLSEQQAYHAVRKHWDDKIGDPDIIAQRLGLNDESTGRDLYEAFSGNQRNQEAASNKLREIGLRGIRYLDAGSRGKDGEFGSHNYVIFDPQHIKTVRRYAGGGGIKAYFMHAPKEMGKRTARSYGGAVPSYIPEERIEDLARRLITFSYAVAPLVPHVKGTYAEGGAVDDAQNAVDIARNLTPMGFYSAAAEAAGKIPQRAPIDQIINKLKGSPNVKGEELDWSGVRDAFAGQKSVDPAQVAQHLQANLPQIQETVYGYDPKTKMKTAIKPRYEQYSTPGGENYREVLLNLPENEAPYYEDFESWFKDNFKPSNPTAEQYSRRYAEQQWKAANGKIPNYKGSNDYHSSHWDTPNILAHLRMSDRGMYGLGHPEALHLEEVQSDWGQEGRDTGFDKRKGLNAEERRELNQLVAVPMRERTNDQMNRFNELINQRDFETIPSAPHVTSTEGWTDLALKRALREAAQGKYKKLTWTPGEDQADRYGLDKSFSEMHYSPDSKELFAKGHEGVDDIHEKVHPEALHSFIGKELASKLLNQPVGENTNRHFLHGDTIQSLSGSGLKMEQKGMRDFYDRMIPNRLQKLVSKLDPEAKVQLYGHNIYVPGEDDPEDGEYKKVHSLEITPKLRAAILKGLPAYAGGGDVGYDRGGSIIRRALDVVSNLPR